MKDAPPPCRTFTYGIAGSDVHIRVHGRYPKTKRDRDALEVIIRAATEMLQARKP